MKMSKGWVGDWLSYLPTSSCSGVFSGFIIIQEISSYTLSAASKHAIVIVLLQIFLQNLVNSRFLTHFTRGYIFVDILFTFLKSRFEWFSRSHSLIVWTLFVYKLYNSSLLLLCIPSVTAKPLAEGPSRHSLQYSSSCNSIELKCSSHKTLFITLLSWWLLSYKRQPYRMTTMGNPINEI